MPKQIKQEAKLKEWGSFFHLIVATTNTLQEKRKQITDPYKQFILDEEIRTCKNVQNLYKTYLDSGLVTDLHKDKYGSQLGISFLEELQNLQAKLTNEASIQKEKYMQVAYRKKIQRVKTISSKFIAFKDE